jgi:hypothetical protein
MTLRCSTFRVPSTLGDDPTMGDRDARYAKSSLRNLVQDIDAGVRTSHTDREVRHAAERLRDS